MQKTSTLAIVLTSVVLLIIVSVYLVLKNFQQKTMVAATDPYSWVPEDAGLVFHIKNPVLFLESITKTGPMADDLEILLSPNHEFDLLHKLDSLFTHHEDINQYWSASSIILSMHPAGTNKHLLANIISTGETHPAEMAASLKEHLFPGLSSETEMLPNGQSIHRISAEEGTPVYYSLTPVSMLLTKERQLLIQAILSEQNKSSVLTANGFSSLKETAGRFADNLFVNTTSLCSMLQEFSPKSWPLAIHCNNLAGWQSWDVSYNTGELILNGLAHPLTEHNSVLHTLGGQKPRDSEIYNHLPYHTGLFFYFGMGNTEGLSGDSTDLSLQFADKEKLAMHRQRFFDITTLSPDSLFKQWQGELALVFSQPQASDNPVLIAGAAKGKQWRNHPELGIFFREISQGETSSGPWQPDIFQINIPGFFPVLTGGMITEDMNFAAFTNDFVIAANDPATLNEYLESLRFGQNFRMSEAHRHLKEILPTGQNILLHISPAILLNGLNPDAHKENQWSNFSYSEELGNFRHISLQYLPGPGSMAFSNMVVKHQPGYSISNPLLWETSLKTKVHKGPFRMINHNTQQPEIIVQDTLSNLYLLNIDGKILWQKEISGPAMSDIYQVDIYKNNRYQYLFNTRNYLHLIDRNGNYVRGFPMRLPAPASAGIAVFDYDNNKNYRIIFPSENRRIYNYTLARRPVSGWRYGRSQNLVQKPVQHIRLGNKDFLIVTDTTGRLEILHRQGTSRIQTRQQVKANPGTSVFAATGNGQQAHFMVAGKTGELNKIFTDGSSARIAPDTFSLQHHFTYAQFTHEQEYDLIYIDDGVLMVYNPLGKLIFSLPFAGEAKAAPRLFNPYDQKPYLGFTDVMNQRLFVVNRQGEISPPFPVAGDTRFFFESPPQKPAMVITGWNDKIRAYNVKH